MPITSSRDPGDDDEGALDCIYASHRELFERGVLPDYWFTLLADASGRSAPP